MNGGEPGTGHAFLCVIGITLLLLLLIGLVYDGMRILATPNPGLLLTIA